MLARMGLPKLMAARNVPPGANSFMAVERFWLLVVVLEPPGTAAQDASRSAAIAAAACFDSLVSSGDVRHARID
jgi:hypothetical protein